MTGTEAFFAALIAVSALAGIILGSRLLEKENATRRQLFVYYTYLSNAAECLYHVLLLIPGPWRSALRSSVARFTAMLVILVTFLIYFFILTRFGKEKPEDRPANKKRFVGNILVHYAVPLLTLAEWLIVADKHGIGVRGALWWMLAPGAYLLFIIFYHSLHREIEHSGRYWPYEFIDLEAIGMKRWLVRVIGVVAGFFALGLAFAGLAALLI